MELVKIKNLKKSKRVGRGLASGKGKTAGRGTKGQKSRSGYNIPRRFEGGQTSLIQRVGKIRGFKSKNPESLSIGIVRIEKVFADNETVNLKTLLEKGLISDIKRPVKILGEKLTKKLKFREVKLNKKLLAEVSKPKEESPKKPVSNPQVKETPSKKVLSDNKK